MLNKSLIEDVLQAALETGGDFSEVFVEDRYTNNMTLQSGRLETSLSGRDFGIGIRVFSGLQSVYAYTNDFSRDGLLKAAKTVAQAIQNQENGKTSVLPLVQKQIQTLHPIKQLPNQVEKMRKLTVMRNANDIARNYDPAITQAIIRLIDEEQNVLIANSEGTFIEDSRVRSRMSIVSVASDGTDMQTGFYGPGAHQGFEFLENLDLDHYAKEASRIAVTMLHADPAPSGKFPVIIDNEFGGVIFHEACGHGLEATAVAKDSSVFANKLGEKVASDLVTYIDDGTLPNEWGSINIDDEGEKSRKNVLIENGILKGYLIDKLNGRRMGMESTGSSRRESYQFAPTSRMTNTYIAPGKSTPEEIIANTEHGIYAKYMGGGQVNPGTGDYNFAVDEAYLVKNGKIDKPLRGATLIGNGATTIQHIDMVGNNLAHGAGMCGASSGSLPVNVGQPMVRVSEITVGGREAKTMELEHFRSSLFTEGEKLGFSDLEISYEKTDKFSCQIFKGEVDGYESSSVQGVSIRGLYQGKTGYAYTEKLDEESVQFLLKNAMENAELLEAEPEEFYSGDATYENIQFYTPALQNVTTEQKINFIKEVEKKANAYDSRVIQVDAAAIQDQAIEKQLFNNQGLTLKEQNNFLLVMVSVRVNEDDEVKSGFHFEITKDFASLNADAIAEEAVEKALSFLGGKGYPNKSYPVILKNTAAASMLATFVSSFSAESVQNDQSRLKGKLGEIIASDEVTLVDDPFLPDGMRSTTFDAEGVPTKKLAVVENGKLNTYFHNQKTAKKDGVESTGHGSKQSYKGTLEVSPSNFFVAPTSESYEQLYRDIDEGVIITDLSGLHSGANPISGDFSLAANGYFVKDGKIVGPTNQMTIAGNFFEVLKDVKQIADDLDFTPMAQYGYIGSPSLRVGSLAVTVD